MKLLQPTFRRFQESSTRRVAGHEFSLQHPRSSTCESIVSALVRKPSETHSTNLLSKINVDILVGVRLFQTTFLVSILSTGIIVASCGRSAETNRKSALVNDNIAALNSITKQQFYTEEGKKKAEALKKKAEALKKSINDANKKIASEKLEIKANQQKLLNQEKHIANLRAVLLGEALTQAHTETAKANEQFIAAKAVETKARKALFSAPESPQLKEQADIAHRLSMAAKKEFEKKESVATILAVAVAEIGELATAIAAEQAAENTKKKNADTEVGFLGTLGAGPVLIVGIIDGTRNGKMDDHQFQARFGIEVHFSPIRLGAKIISQSRPSAIDPHSLITEFTEIRSWDLGILSALYNLDDDEMSGMLGVVVTRNISKIDGSAKRLMNLGFGVLMDREEGSTRLGVGLSFSAGLGILKL